MRFIDANVFIYAVLKPNKPLPGSLMQVKTAAREIFLRVNAGEPVLTTTVHLSEVANVLEDAAGHTFSTSFISTVLMKSTISVEPVSADDYRESCELAQKRGISINDALSVIIMERQGIGEIYTFDRHFSQTGVRVMRE
jgi:predicted nucleic acid-binding protein